MKYLDSNRIKSGCSQTALQHPLNWERLNHITHKSEIGTALPQIKKKSVLKLCPKMYNNVSILSQRSFFLFTHLKRSQTSLRDFELSALSLVSMQFKSAVLKVVKIWNFWACLRGATKQRIGRTHQLKWNVITLTRRVELDRSWYESTMLDDKRYSLVTCCHHQNPTSSEQEVTFFYLKSFISDPLEIVKIVLC